MISQEQADYLLEVGFTPQVSAVISVLFRFGTAVPEYYLSEQQEELNEAITKGFVVIDSNSKIQLTNKTINTLETIKFLRDSANV